MGKQTKRERKFKASGGIQGRLRKGALPHKGKSVGLVKKKRITTTKAKQTKHDVPSRQSDTKGQQTKKSDSAVSERPNDFMSVENLGALDVDSFFERFTESIEKAQKQNGQTIVNLKEGAKVKLSKTQQQQRQQESDHNDSQNESDNSSGEESDTSEPDLNVKLKHAKAISSPQNDEMNDSEGKQDRITSGSDSSSSSNDDDDDDLDEDEDDSDDEDVDKAEARMKAELANMRRTDPEFHDFLQENERGLLDFGNDDDDDNVDDEDEGEDDHDMQVNKHGGNEANDEDDKRSASQSQQVSQIELTSELLATLTKSALTTYSVKSLKKLVAAFKSACHLADAGSDLSNNTARPGESGIKYLIDSSKVFDDLMVHCLNQCHEAFAHHLLNTSKDVEEGDDDGNVKATNETSKQSRKGGNSESVKAVAATSKVKDIDDNEPLHPKVLEKAKRWPDVRHIVYSFLRSIVNLLDQAKDPELLTFVLKALAKYVRFMTPFPYLAQAMLRTLTILWSAPLDSSEDYQVVRLNAFLRIRQMALTQPFPLIEDCLKKTYLAYARRAKFGTSSSVSAVMPTLTFMGNCLVELYSLDYHSSYQHGFVYIRQLALLIRSAITKQTPEAMQQVYCWQYLHCLKLWVAVLASAAQSDDGAMMRSLIYPLTEVILGVARHVPARIRHLPILFHCVRFLQQLAASSETFTPTTSLLLDILEWKEWTLPSKKSRRTTSSGVFQMQLLLKLPKEDTLRTHEQLEAGMSELFVLLQREIELYRYTAGFPEFAVRIIQRVKALGKITANRRWKTYTKACIDVCDRYTREAVQARSKLTYSPKDARHLECLRPNDRTPTMHQRHQASIDKEQKEIDYTVTRRHLSQKDATITSSDQNLPPDSSEDESGSDQEQAKGDDEDGALTKTKTRNKRKATNNNLLKKDKGLQKKAAKQSAILDEEDQLEEGVNWSDDDDDDDDE